MHDIFYFTDIHGMYDLYHAIVNYCIEQDPECMIIFGGDACDRGPDGYKIMKEMLDNPQIGYLKGNHEDMFVQAACAIKREYKGPIDDAEINKFLVRMNETDGSGLVEVAQCVLNGGFKTMKDWMLDGMPMDIIDRLFRLQVTLSYEDIDFCHAGGTYDAFCKVAEAEYSDEWPDLNDETILIWDRNYIPMAWENGRMCIFGHTPVPVLKNKYHHGNVHEPCKYIGKMDDRFTGIKIDMDTGAFYTGIAFVLNVLTMKAQGFKDNDIKNNAIRKHDIEKIDIIQL